MRGMGSVLKLKLANILYPLSSILYPLTSLVGARKKRDDYLLMVENGKNPKYKSNNSKLFRDIALDWLQIQDDWLLLKTSG
jgi:hypothetical protein